MCYLCISRVSWACLGFAGTVYGLEVKDFGFRGFGFWEVELGASRSLRGGASGLESRVSGVRFEVAGFVFAQASGCLWAWRLLTGTGSAFKGA